MARKKVAENTPPAKPQDKAEVPTTTPRLQVSLSGQAPEPGPRLASALDAFGIVGRELSQADREHFMVLHLDNKNRLLAKEVISTGNLNASIVHPREVFKGAVLNGSAAILCVHNHPSGDPTPSQEDRETTARLKQAADLVGIRLLDHLIVGRGPANYFSFTDSGTMPPLPPTKENPASMAIEGAGGVGDTAGGISREEAKGIIDAAANRMTFLLETVFSTPMTSHERICTGFEGVFGGLDFVFFEAFLSLEDLYYRLYPEELPEGQDPPKGWSGNPPSWDKPDMSCALVAPRRALEFLWNSFAVHVGDHEKISEQGFSGMGAIVKDIRADLYGLSSGIEQAIRGASAADSKTKPSDEPPGHPGGSVAGRAHSSAAAASPQGVPDVSCDLAMIEDKLEFILEAGFEQEGGIATLSESAISGISVCLYEVKWKTKEILEKLYPGAKP